MTTGLLLVFLMGLDTAFAGYRADAGRTGHIRIARRRGRAMAIGVALGWAVGAVLFAAILVLGAVSDELIQVGDRLVLAYGVFAAVIGLGFVVRAIPSVDVRAVSSIVVFGPLTLARPGVILGVAVWACLGASAPTWAIVAAGVTLVLGMEQLLERRLFNR